MADERDEETRRWTLPILVARVQRMEQDLQKFESEGDRWHRELRDAVTAKADATDVKAIAMHVADIKASLGSFKGYVFGCVAAGMAGATVVAWVVQLLTAK